jgi:hypothetical protein
MEASNNNKNIALRADVMLLVERYFSLLESKYSIFLSSDELLSGAVHSIKTNNYESADDILVSHEDIIERINLVDFDCASVVQQLSRITGIDDTSNVMSKIIARDKTMLKKHKVLLKKINECAVQSEKKLSFIADSFESKMNKDTAALRSLEIVDKLRDKIILPLK